MSTQLEPQAQKPAVDAVNGIPTYLVFSILSIVLLFWPTGIAALVHAVQSLTSAKANDLAKAQSEADLARKWCYVSLKVGIVVAVITTVISFIYTIFILTLTTRNHGYYF